MNIRTVIVLFFILIFFFIWFYFKDKSKEMEQKIIDENRHLALTVILHKERVKDSKDTLAKNILVNVELGANIAGCFFGLCGVGSKTLGLVTERIE